MGAHRSWALAPDIPISPPSVSQCCQPFWLETSAFRHCLNSTRYLQVSLELLSTQEIMRDGSLTKPCDVLVVPGQRFLAASVQRSSARHPPESVNVSSGVKVSSPQQAHSSEALFSCKHRPQSTWLEVPLTLSYIPFEYVVPTVRLTFW